MKRYKINRKSCNLNNKRNIYSGISGKSGWNALFFRRDGESPLVMIKWPFCDLQVNILVLAVTACCDYLVVLLEWKWAGSQNLNPLSFMKDAIVGCLEIVWTSRRKDKRSWKQKCKHRNCLLNNQPRVLRNVYRSTSCPKGADNQKRVVNHVFEMATIKWWWERYIRIKIDR